MPRESGHDDQELARYLLGLLPDEDTERLDELSIADEQIAARLVEVENDLVDAYVRGDLHGETLERFESSYLASPLRRQKVRFAAGLASAIDRAATRPDSDEGSGAPPAPQQHGPSSGLSLPVRPPSGSALGWGLAIAAAVVLVAGGSLLVKDLRLRDGLSQAQQQSAALAQRARELEQQLENQRSASAQAEKELEQVRASLAELTERSPTRSGSPQSVPPSQQLALVLTPQTRGSGPFPTVAVPPGAERVALELQLEANDFARYDAVLKDPATNAALWRSARMAATLTGDQSTVAIAIPAGELKSQHYMIELSGYTAAADAEMVGGYMFRIVRK